MQFTDTPTGSRCMGWERKGNDTEGWRQYVPVDLLDQGFHKQHGKGILGCLLSCHLHNKESEDLEVEEQCWSNDGGVMPSLEALWKH